MKSFCNSVVSDGSLRRGSECVCGMTNFFFIHADALTNINII